MRPGRPRAFADHRAGAAPGAERRRGAGSGSSGEVSEMPRTVPPQRTAGGSKGRASVRQEPFADADSCARRMVRHDFCRQGHEDLARPPWKSNPTRIAARFRVPFRHSGCSSRVPFPYQHRASSERCTVSLRERFGSVDFCRGRLTEYEGSRRQGPGRASSVAAIEPPVAGRAPKTPELPDLWIDSWM